jgi:hypothetical protein
MFQLDKHVKFLQFLAALLAIPAGVAGTYAVYRSYMSGGVSCNELRSTIIATMDRNISPDAKRTLLKEDVTSFDKYCAEKDPEARIVFDAAVAPPKPAQDLSGAQTVAVSMGVTAPGSSGTANQTSANPAAANSAPSNSAGANQTAALPPSDNQGPAKPPGAIFGLSRSGEKRGWVALIRRDEDQNIVPNFDGFSASPPVAPKPGTVLKARRPLFVWLQPPPAGQKNDATQMQGRIAIGECVKVLTNGPPATKFWTEVAPEKCE